MNHILFPEGPVGKIDLWQWRCSCGTWGPRPTPASGPYARTTNKARIAQIKMSHDAHVRAVAQQAAKVTL